MKIAPCGIIHPEFKHEKPIKKDGPQYVPQADWKYVSPLALKVRMKGVGACLANVT